MALTGFHDPARRIRGVRLAIMVDHRIWTRRFTAGFLLAALLLLFSSFGQLLLLCTKRSAVAASSRRSLASCNRVRRSRLLRKSGGSSSPRLSLPCRANVRLAAKDPLACLHLSPVQVDLAHLG